MQVRLHLATMAVWFNERDRVKGGLVNPNALMRASSRWWQCSNDIPACIILCVQFCHRQSEALLVQAGCNSSVAALPFLTSPMLSRDPGFLTFSLLFCPVVVFLIYLKISCLFLVCLCSYANILPRISKRRKYQNSTNFAVNIKTSQISQQFC